MIYNKFYDGKQTSTELNKNNMNALTITKCRKLHIIATEEILLLGRYGTGYDQFI
jgi:hypothetical protein